MESLNLASNSKQKKQNRPFLEVRTFETITKKVVISTDSSLLLKNYTAYLSSFNEKKITEDDVLDALIIKLKNDKEFEKWLKIGNIVRD